MKRLLVLLLFMLLLTGCTQPKNYIDPENLNIVTALGVIQTGNEMVCFIEAPYPQEDNDAIKTASGKTVAEAINNVTKQFIGKVLFSQCPVILVDDNAGAEAYRQLFDICISEYDFSLSVIFVNCRVEDAFKIKPKNSIGHDVFKILNGNTNLSLDHYNSKFSNIYNDYVSKENFYLLHFDVNDGALVIDGATKHIKQ